MVRQCDACRAMFSDVPMYLGDSYTLVLPYWHEGPSNPESERYFDFTVIGSKGVERRHGWFNIHSRRIVQVG